MKRLSQLVFLSLSFSFAAQGQTQSMAQATYALAGPVRSLRTETATPRKDGQYLVAGPRVLRMTAEFNEDGNRTELGIYNEQGVLVRTILMKFEGRRMIESVNYDGAGKMWLRQTWQYDKAGQIVGQTSYDGDESESVRSKTVYKRNEQGQLVEVVTIGANGEVLERMTSTYTASGVRNTSEREVRYPNRALHIKEFYDMPQKRVETISYKPDGTIQSRQVRVDQEIVEYDEDGSLKKTTSISNQGRLLFNDEVSPDGSHKRDAQVPDEVDSHGNWIKQTTWVTDSNGTRAVLVTYRTITYYEK